MKTLMECAQNNEWNDIFEKAFSREKNHISKENFLQGISEGTIVIPANKYHTILQPRAIGAGLTTKVNVNLGVSEDKVCFEEEYEKVAIAEKFGADAIMDLSTGELGASFRKKLVHQTFLPLGTVPLYDCALRYGGNIADITVQQWFDVAEEHMKDGIDFLTIHAGLTQSCLEHIPSRLTKIVSRGGSILAEWMTLRKEENPFYQHFDLLLELCRTYEVTLSLGDGLRPGSLYDAGDAAQISENIQLGKLVKRCRKAKVQSMVEGPGHIPLHEVESNIKIGKKLCHNAPFYVLGPLVMDCGAGYDHISAAIGGAVASMHGADFLCYVTPAEHLSLPSVEDVKEGLIATRMAAHAGDLAKGFSLQKDKEMSEARMAMDWKKMIELSFDPEKARTYKNRIPSSDEHTCTMCGSLCAMKRSSRVIKSGD